MFAKCFKLLERKVNRNMQALAILGIEMEVRQECFELQSWCVENRSAVVCLKGSNSKYIPNLVSRKIQNLRNVKNTLKGENSGSLFCV